MRPSARSESLLKDSIFINKSKDDFSLNICKDIIYSCFCPIFKFQIIVNIHPN